MNKKSDQMRDAVTADHVAELAGVSRWTVNRAFKQDASISSKSREKVLKIAEQLGYAPDLLASSLASDKSNLIALLIDDFVNPHKLVMMENMTRLLRKNGWDTLLVNTGDKDDAPAALLNASQRRVDAAVLIGSNFDDAGLATALGARKIRKLIVFARSSADPNTISICCDDEVAMADVTDHVIQKGYQRPFFVAGPQTESAHVARKDTFIAKWREATGQTPDFAVINAYDQRLSFEFVSEFLAKCEPDGRPDILVCENDAIATGAIDAARHKHGLRIPQDIAVTGFDDAPFASNPNYQITTYQQPIMEMVEAFVQILKGEPIPNGLDKFTGRLVVRESA